MYSQGFPNHTIRYEGRRVYVQERMCDIGGQRKRR